MNQRAVVLLVAVVQFVNVLDLMLVMPLGPDFALSLGIPTSQIGLVSGSYTLAAGLAGLTGSLFLDRFDRRSAFCVALAGLVLGTALCGVATGLSSLLAARVLAGACSGPVTSLAFAIVSDLVPPEKRGRAMGTVMTASAVASIAGVPAGLKLAEWYDWRLPFFVVAAFGFVLVGLVRVLVRPMRSHLERASARAGAAASFDGVGALAITSTALLGASVFCVLPSLSTFLQKNVGYPRNRIDLLYLVGGAATLVATRAVGSLVDRFGATRIATAGTALFALTMYFGFIRPVAAGAVIFVFPLLMLSASLRGVPVSALASRVPPLAQRARFMSLLTAVQHFASTGAALGASAMLGAEADGRLIGMTSVAVGSIALALLVPPLSLAVERRVMLREGAIARPGATTSAPAA